MSAREPPVMQAPMITYDADVEATIGCLSAYARTWPRCPLLFVIPINDERTRSRIEAAVRGLRIAYVLCAKDISSTLQALLKFCTGSEWIFLCNSDRYPLAFPSLDRLGSMTERLVNGQHSEISPGVNAIKLFRWRETAASEYRPCKFSAQEFSTIDTQATGFYHHHFIRKRFLESLLDSRNDFSNIYSFHDHLLSSRPQLWHGETLLPASPIAKFGEATVGGKVTLNFSASMGSERRATLDVEGWTKVFTSPVTPASNQFWREEGIAARDVLEEEAPPASAILASFCSKCLSGVEAEGLDACLAATHRRLPFSRLSSNQRAFYMFEDPRETILAMFDDARSGRRSISSYFKQAQISAPPVEPNWNLATFLAGGLDHFRLEEHFDFWFYGVRSYEVTFVRREATAKAGPPLDRIGRTPGFHDWSDPESRQRFNAIYAPFARRLALLPDVFSA